MRWLRRLLRTMGVILLIWLLLTVWAQNFGPEVDKFIPSATGNLRAIMVYNPDPIYNLDEKVLTSFALGIGPFGYSTNIKTIQYAKEETPDYDLIVLCTNTYNWTPDFKMRNFVKTNRGFNNVPIVAITLGAGSTTRSKNIFDKTIVQSGANLIDSKTLWLLRPNDDERMDEKNTKVAQDLVTIWSKEIVAKLKE